MTGTSVLGIKYAGGVMLAADTLGSCSAPGKTPRARAASVPLLPRARATALAAPRPLAQARTAAWRASPTCAASAAWVARR